MPTAEAYSANSHKSSFSLRLDATSNSLPLGEGPGRGSISCAHSFSDDLVVIAPRAPFSLVDHHVGRLDDGFYGVAFFEPEALGGIARDRRDNFDAARRDDYLVHDVAEF